MPILGHFEEAALVVALAIDEMLSTNDEYQDLLDDLIHDNHPELALDGQELTPEEELERDALLNDAQSEVENRILDRAIRAMKNSEDPLWHKRDDVP